jgi:hypothetical protein
VRTTRARTPEKIRYTVESLESNRLLPPHETDDRALRGCKDPVFISLARECVRCNRECNDRGNGAVESDRRGLRSIDRIAAAAMQRCSDVATAPVDRRDSIDAIRSSQTLALIYYTSDLIHQTRTHILVLSNQRVHRNVRLGDLP